MIKKIFSVNLLSVIVISALFYYLFSFSIYNLLGFLLGTLSIILINKKEAFQQLILIGGGGIIAYIFYEDPAFLASLLIGANITAYYLQIQSTQKPKIQIDFLNVILLSAIVLSSSIEKFRGFNKLATEDIQLTIPLLLLSSAAIYFLALAIYTIKPTLKKKRSQQVFAIATTTLVAIYYLIGAMFYKEVGISVIFVPLTSGIGVALIETLIQQKRSIIADFSQVVLLIIWPYSVSGLLGIALAMLSTHLFKNLIIPALEESRPSTESTIFKASPLLFLFAAAEIRENAGQITRFNLITGYQMGWVIIAPILLESATSYIDKIRKILEENKIEKVLPLVVTLFTILVLTLIIKFGRDEALSSLIVGTSVYLFLASLVTSGKKSSKLNLVSSLGNAIGAVAFLMLTRL